MLVQNVIDSPEDIATLDYDKLVLLAESGKKAQTLNSQRSALKNRLDELLEHVPDKALKI